MTAVTYPWHEIPWQQFAHAKRTAHLPHALLLSGISGLGKQEFAKQMIESILCLSPTETMHACGHCQSCLLLNAESHPDYNLVAPEEQGKQIKVDQIRALIEKQSLTPKISSWKAVLINHADNLNISAFNSLLKLLEEPQANTVLILISEKLHQLPITIRSRCQNLIINAPEERMAVQWLTNQCSDLSAGDWQRLLKMYQGAPVATLKAKDTGTIQITQLEQALSHLLTGKVNPITLSQQWQQYDLVNVMHYLQTLIQDRLQSNLTQKKVGDTSENERLWQISDCITNTIKLISSPNNLNKSLLIEEFMVSVMHINSDRAGR